MSWWKKLGRRTRTAARRRPDPLWFERLEAREVPALSPFTPDNLVVLKVGNGSATLVNTGNTVFLDEFTPAGALVQEVAVPGTNASVNKALTLSGTTPD